MRATQCAVLVLPFVIALAANVALGARGGGGMGSGGGKAVVCRADDGSIDSAELLDLYEAVYRYGWKLRAPVGDLTDEYGAYVRELRRIAGDPRPFSTADRIKFQDVLARHYRFQPAGDALEDLEDVGETIEPPVGCAIEQLAIYDDELEIVDVASDIWDVLSPMHKAATIAHEELYKDHRSAGDDTSEQVRKLVGRLFSTNPPATHRASVPRGATFCFAGAGGDEPQSSQFYLFQDDGGTVLHFTRLMGRDTFYPVQVRLATKIDVAQLKPISYAKARILTVTDKRARYYRAAPIQGGLFDAYSVGVRYVAHQPFLISLISGDGDQRRVMQQTYVTSCHAPPSVTTHP